MMKHLINHNEVGTFSRPISGQIDANRVNSYIAEAEQTKVKKAIGDSLLNYLQTTDESILSDQYKLLLNGGTYEALGQTKILQGLRVAIAYYTYAKLILNNPVNVTRFGTRIMENGQSQPIEWKQLQTISIDAESYADSVLNEVVGLLNAKRENYPLYQGGQSKVNSNRTLIKIIGV